MKRGDIYFVNLDPTLGHEQRGRRPVVIVTLERFNRATSVPIILPITSGGDFARRSGFAVSLSGLGMKTTGIVRCDQPRAVDLATRDPRFVETLPSEIMEEILEKLASLLS